MEKSADTDLEPYYRLVEMQKQMIDLIQRNAHTERECAALREQLAREAEALARSRRSLPDRLRDSASGLLKRLMRRNYNSAASMVAQSQMQHREWPRRSKLEYELPIR